MEKFQPYNPHHENAAHPAECGKIIRSYHTENDRPWGSVGIKFDVTRNNSDCKLIIINGSKQESPADWQTMIVSGQNVRSKREECGEPAIRGQSTSSYSTTS